MIITQHEFELQATYNFETNKYFTKKVFHAINTLNEIYY